MKEHKDDVLSSVKKSERGKIEEIFGERESEDMVVDVVTADVAVDRETDHVMEDVDVVKQGNDDVVSVEVVKEVVVVQENVAVTVTAASGSGCDDRKSGGGEVEVRESVQEVGDGDHVVEGKSEKDTEALDSLKISESTEGGVVGKDKVEDGVDSQVSPSEAVDAGTCEGNVSVSVENTEIEGGVEEMEKESVESTNEGTTNDCQKSGNGTQVGDSEKVVELDKGVTEESVEQSAESVRETADVDCVTSEETRKDEVQDSVIKVDEVITEEGLEGKDVTQVGVSEDQSQKVNTGASEGAAVDANAENLVEKAEVDQKNDEDGSQSTIEVRTHDDSKSGKETEAGDSKMEDEPEIIKGEIDVIDKGDGDQDSSKISQSSIMASLGLEEVDVVVVDEGLEEKNEEQDPVSVEPSLVNPDDQSKTSEVVNVGTGEVDPKAEDDSTSKDESSFATIKPDEVAASGKVDEVSVSQKEPNPDVQISADGGILVENQSIDVNVMTDSPKPDVVASTEPESATDKLTPSIVNEVVETDIGVQTIKVEPATFDHHSSDFQVGQELNANQSIQGIEIAAEVPTTDGQDGVLPANTEFSYEDAHMERGEDAGMDIDEVLGWKDEIPTVQEAELKVEMQEAEALEHTLDPEQQNKTPVSLQQSCYFHPPENEGEFSVSDLVWGKVRSHPWWPGQIFDPSDASEKSMKYHKKDCFLVAYFGDRTFAWNDSAVLKPFRENFSEIVDNMNSEGFNNAVHCALQEVSRRVELGLTCSCIPHEIYENIKCQIVENSGIKQESSRRHGVDKSANVSSFEPDMLVDYVRLLAKFPYGEGDKMELTIAKAQLSSYGRFKGHRQLAEFQLCGDLLEAEQVIKEETYSEDGSKKRKALDSISDGSEKRPTLQTEAVTFKPPSKVGGSIQKVASQVTGPSEQVTGLGPDQLGNQADMLSQLHQAAQDPMKGYGFVNNIIPFFNSHRSTVLSKSSLNSSNDARKRKTSNENQSEDFEFDDVNDSYWTDRIIQNNQEENPLQENQNGGGVHQMVAYEQERQSAKPARRSNKKRFFSSNHEIEAKEQSELIERRRKNLATEVLMKFTEGIYFPSEIHLNKMFRRFGPLMESETEVDRQGGRARVVFKKCSDAEVAHNSAGKFNIFGSINVHYELNYTPLISYKPLPLPAQDPAHAC